MWKLIGLVHVTVNYKSSRFKFNRNTFYLGHSKSSISGILIPYIKLKETLSEYGMIVKTHSIFYAITSFFK